MGKKAASKTTPAPKPGGVEAIRTPAGTPVEVFARKGDRVIKMPGQMRFDEYLTMKKQPGWNYQAYEPGFCSIKTTE